MLECEHWREKRKNKMHNHSLTHSHRHEMATKTETTSREDKIQNKLPRKGIDVKVREKFVFFLYIGSTQQIYTLILCFVISKGLECTAHTHSFSLSLSPIVLQSFTICHLARNKTRRKMK